MRRTHTYIVLRCGRCIPPCIDPQTERERKDNRCVLLSLLLPFHYDPARTHHHDGRGWLCVSLSGLPYNVLGFCFLICGVEAHATTLSGDKDITYIHIYIRIDIYIHINYDILSPQNVARSYPCVAARVWRTPPYKATPESRSSSLAYDAFYDIGQNIFDRKPFPTEMGYPQLNK